ncbi:S-layer homology domain-containing protein [Desulforamulus putei]|uniref:Ig-like domain-containing protein n=1 Tax=Desulforamulus putei DSM 12395 TaxID=1121429 RepID=A0A1M4TV00_9FIRM|nr:S-layer homology domain-containing protein [Desulforamulus putei]SHE48300.1 Ig-like domain-containing protein [Desulforamulus putei DSM 12395]
MKKITKLMITLLSVCLLTALLASAAWASPSRAKENRWPPGLQKKQQLMPQMTFVYGFVDIQNHWAKKEIEKMQSKGIMKGYEGKQFKPQQPVTKNEAIAIIMRVVDHKETSTDKAGLIKKVFPGWMGAAPLQAYDAGIIADWELMAWNGNKPATRIEVAMWLCRAAGDKNVSLKEMLSFAKDANQLSKDELIYAAAMYNRGIMRGTPDGYLNPFKPISRGEFAVMISRFIDSADMDDNRDDVNNGEEFIETLNPASNSRVAVDTDEFTIKFKEAMVFVDGKDMEDLPEAVKIFKYQNSKWVDAGLEYAIVFKESDDELTVKLDSSATLDHNAKYCITVAGGILQKDDDDSAFSGIDKGQWTFITEGAALAVDEVKATGATTVVVAFNQNISKGEDFDASGNGIHVVDGDRELDVDAATVSGNKLTVTLDADDSLEDGEVYTIWFSDDIIKDFTLDQDKAIAFKYQN